LPYLLSVILLFLGFIILALPFIGVMMAMGMDFKPPIDTVPPAALFIILLLTVVILAVAVRLLLASPIASLEGLGPVAILKRSWQLSAGHFWRLFGFLILFLIAAIVVLGVVSMIAGLIAAVAGEAEPFSVAALIVALLTSVASAAVTTVFVVMLTRMYVQLAGRDAEIEEVFR
jgi:membrane-anchored glycerophosphoryl diester phosphodiesterase (GDPDase)